MKLPSWRWFAVRVAVLLLVVAVTFGWAVRNPKTVDRFSRIIGAAFTTHSGPLVLELRKQFRDCGHWEIANTGFQSEAAFKRALDEHPEYRQEQTEAHHFRFRSAIAGLCSICRTHRFLGLYRQEVVVFRGIPTRPGPIEEKVPIQLSLLPEQELSDLKQGIPFKDAKEKLQLIEGLNSLGAQ